MGWFFIVVKQDSYMLKKRVTQLQLTGRKNSYFLVKRIFIRNIKGLKHILITNQLYSV